jgi:putative membrane protein
MIDDYTRINQELAVIAARENIVMPQDLDSEHAQLREKLAGLHGADFDRAYVNTMRDDQQKTLDLLKSSGALVSADELRTFIRQKLPMVQEHLRCATRSWRFVCISKIEDRALS